MKKKMTLARALKEKARLASKIALLHDTISMYNSMDQDERRPVDVRELLGQLNNCNENKLRVKEAIAQANVPIAKKLAELKMLSAEITFFERLGMAEFRSEQWRKVQGMERKIPSDVTFKTEEVMKLQEELKERLDDVQDDVDAYDAVTMVEVDMV